MTVLSQNIKTIRKYLNCTQMATAEVLNVGFRTYIRYEAGQRDAPVSVLIKLAKLGNLSLDHLLTTKIQKHDLAAPPADTPPAKACKLKIIGGSISEGRLVFKNLKGNYFISANENEKKLISSYRKMDRLTRKKCLLEIEQLLKNTKGRYGENSQKNWVSKKTLKAKNTTKLKRTVRSISKTTLKG